MDSLERQVQKRRGASRLPQRLCDRIDAKYKRHAQAYRAHLDGIAHSLKTQPSLYDQAASLPTLAQFFRSHIVIVLAGAQLTQELWCVPTSGWVKIARYPNRLLLSNPISQKDESWAKLASASKSAYTVHHQDGGRNNKSRFLGNFDFIEPLECAVFNKGIGVLRSSREMRLYAHFEERIGKSAQGSSLTYLCLEISRIARKPRHRPSGAMHKSGWMLRVHGYPAGADDVNRDLRHTPLTTANLPTLVNPT